MKKFKKLIAVGPNSVHVENYLKLVKDQFEEIILIAEEKTDFSVVDRSYIVPFRSKNPFSLFKSYKALKKIILAEKSDVIHVHSIYRVTFFLGILLSKLKLKFISTAWGSDVLLVPKRNFIAKQLVVFSLKKSCFVTADSSEMITRIKELSPNTKTEQLFYGIDGVKELEKENVIYSNRLHNPIYNIDHIINYFKIFAEENSDWKLVIGAIGSETERLKQLVVDNGLKDKVEFIGWVDKKTNDYYYGIAKLYISVPESDGTAVSLMEAMSAGCIPIVSNLLVSKEWVKDNVTGVIVDKQEKDPISRALLVDLEKAKAANKMLINKKATKEIAQKAFNKIFVSNCNA